jgi:hypothetical protein
VLVKQCHKPAMWRSRIFNDPQKMVDLGLVPWFEPIVTVEFPFAGSTAPVVERTHRNIIELVMYPIDIHMIVQ